MKNKEVFMDYNILRENDIRGNYPKQINKEVAKRLGESCSYYLKENNHDYQSHKQIYF